MNITIITREYNLDSAGGGARSIDLLIRYLSTFGFTFNVVSFDRKRGKGWVNYEGYKGYRFKANFLITNPIMFPIYTLIAMKIFEKQTDVFHIYDVLPIPGAGLYKKLRGKKKVVATLNNYGIICPIYTAAVDGKQCTICNFKKRNSCISSKMNRKRLNPALWIYSYIYPFITSLFSKNLDYYVSLSESVEKIYMDFGFPSSRIRTIPNAYDMQYFSKGVKEKDFSNHRLIYVGRVVEKKGVEILISAFSKVSRKMEGVKLDIIGDGKDKYISKLKKMSAEYGIYQKVNFLGYMNYDQLQEVYKTADLFVHPALWPEPFGRTLLEALSTEIPIIVSDIGFPAQLIKGLGRIVTPGDDNELAEAILDVLTERQYNQSEKRVERLNRYSPDLTIKQYVDVYKALL